jgi:hypothetical protein
MGGCEEELNELYVPDSFREVQRKFDLFAKYEIKSHAVYQVIVCL